MTMIVLLLALVQAVDVAVHIATDQFEPIRVLSNLVVVIGAVAALVRPGSASTVLLVAGAGYLGLNLLFVALHGVVNPSSGAPRTALLVFVLASLALVFWQRARMRD
jgi:hypothetical protein